jgi:hypothetical protein
MEKLKVLPKTSIIENHKIKELEKNVNYLMIENSKKTKIINELIEIMTILDDDILKLKIKSRL